MNDRPRDDRSDREEREEFERLAEGLQPPKAPWQKHVDDGLKSGGELVRRMWAEAIDRSSPSWPPTWLQGAAIALALVVFVFIVLPLLSGVAGWIGGAAAGATSTATWSAGLDLAHVVTDAVRTWLAAHATGLPVGWDLLWTLWCATGITLFILGALSAKGARIGWVLFGAGTAAMVYSASPAPVKWTAVGITAMWWTLGALFAMRRIRDTAIIVTDETPTVFKRAHTRPVRDACELLDALNVRLTEGRRDVIDADELALDVDGVAALVRETRAGLLTTREFAVDDPTYPGANPWHRRLAPFVQPAGVFSNGTGDDYLVSEHVLDSMLTSVAEREAHRLLTGLTARRGDPWRQGTPLHPGDSFGEIVAWNWHTDKGMAMSLLTDYISQARFHDPLAKKLIEKIRLQDVLEGLPMALPDRFSADDIRELTARAHADIPGRFDDDITK